MLTITIGIYYWYMFILEAETFSFWKQREEPELVERKSPNKDDVEANAGVASA